MKRRSPANDLIDEFTPTSLREMGVFEFQHKADSPQAPRICEQGPCTHYHRLETQMDVAAPQDGTEAGLFTQVHHACYPDVGIEIELGDTPVITCNRWTPTAPTFKTKRLEVEKRHFKTKEGKQFFKDLRAWTELKKKQQEEIERAAQEEAERLQAEEASNRRAAQQLAGNGLNPDLDDDDNRPPDDVNPFGGAA